MSKWIRLSALMVLVGYCALLGWACSTWGSPVIPLWYTCQWSAVTVTGGELVNGKTSVPAPNLASAVNIIGAMVRRTPTEPPSPVTPFKYIQSSVLVNPSDCTESNCFRKCSMEVPQGLTGSGSGNGSDVNGGVPVCSDVGVGGGASGAGGGSGTSGSGLGGAATSGGVGGSFGVATSGAVGVGPSGASGAGGGA